MFVELSLMYKCYLPLAIKLGIPVIGTTAYRSLSYLDYIVGNSRNPAVFPKEIINLNRKMLFFERLFNLFEEVSSKVLEFIEKRQLEHFLKQLTGYPDQNPHNYSISLVFSNNHDIFLPRAVPGNAINIGGMGVKSAILDPLPKVCLQNNVKNVKISLKLTHIKIIIRCFKTIFHILRTS